MTTLKLCRSSYEAVVCLRYIKELLNNIDRADRIKFCKVDLMKSLEILQSQNSIWSNEISSEVVEILMTYFNQNLFNKLPCSVIEEIFLWIPIDDFSLVSSVCKEWKTISTSDEIWKVFYGYKFLRSNKSVSYPINSGIKNGGSSFISLFYSRHIEPEIGDKVEVKWKGKFRLEAADVYQGLAWWVAEVVDKHSIQGKYKIRYPGWESKWDEWIPRANLRWSVDVNVVTKVNVNDTIELWCCGSNVPGAWLESRVKKINGLKYCIGRVAISQSGPQKLWVERDRIRIPKVPLNSQNISSSKLNDGGSNSNKGRINKIFHRITETTIPSCSIM
jgi:hypothetical protein